MISNGDVTSMSNLNLALGLFTVIYLGILLTWLSLQ